jgi:hypothetical protein
MLEELPYMCRSALVLALATLMAGAAPVAAQTIEDVTLGELWWGDAVTAEDMAGRVVLIEMWGRN